ncbi:MAG: enoyl-CoA hydratase/isomerase family protein [Chloroflexi bacterium]|nr:enoyl-CoA hydratase/isomerase family protein [Chloroflexota bacterium]
MESTSVLYEKEGHIATITLNRPEIRNAIDEEMAMAIEAAVDRAGGDDEVWVVVVKAVGKSFCAGVDLSYLVEHASGTGEGAVERGVNRNGHIGWSAYRLFSLEKPTIAAVRGHAFGGGLGIALACDIRIAADDAQLSAVFTKRGLAPDSGTSYFLVQSVGYAKACELAFTARTVDAAEAERLGLVNRVVPIEQVDAEAMRMAQEIVQQAPVALRMAKRALRRRMEDDVLSAFEYELYVNTICGRTQDLAEGGKAFLEKRPPRWLGR